MQRLIFPSAFKKGGKSAGDALRPDCAAGTCRAPFLSLSPLLPVTDDAAAARRIRENTFTSGQTCPGPRPSLGSSPLVPSPGQSLQYQHLALVLLLSLLTLHRSSLFLFFLVYYDMQRD